MYTPLPGRLVLALVTAVGDAVAEGPVAELIRAWSPAGAAVAWTTLAAAVTGLFYGSVATAGRPVSRVLLAACALVALVSVFVHLVRAEQRRERERGGLRLARRRPRPGAG